MSERPQAESAVPDLATTEIADGQDRLLDPRSVMVARLTVAIWLLVLAVPIVIAGLFFLIVSTANRSVLLGLGLGALAYVAFFLWCLYWPGVRYRHASYRVGDRGLWIRRGVLWREEISVPKSRVQHTDVSQGPLQRRFDLGTLVLHTAGTQNAAVALSGLPHETALAIRDHLIDSGLDHAT